jgi:hypothetical protein
MRDFIQRIHHGGTEARRNPGSRSLHAVDETRNHNQPSVGLNRVLCLPPCLRVSVVNSLIPEARV